MTSVKEVTVGFGNVFTDLRLVVLAVAAAILIDIVIVIQLARDEPHMRDQAQ